MVYLLRVERPSFSSPVYLVKTRAAAIAKAYVAAGVRAGQAAQRAAPTARDRMHARASEPLAAKPRIDSRLHLPFSSQLTILSVGGT